MGDKWLVEHVAALARIKAEFEQLKEEGKLRRDAQFERYIKDLVLLAEDVYEPEMQRRVAQSLS